MSFPRYERYRDSGVAWLGEVPTDWKVQRLRDSAGDARTDFTDGDWIEAPLITSEGVRLIQTGNVGIGRYKEQGGRFISEESFSLLRCSEVSAGDVLICRLADPVGRACLAPEFDAKMITSVDVCIVKTHAGIEARFLVYFLSSAEYLGFMESECRGGTRDRVSRSFLAQVPWLVPPLDDQVRIAAVLDREMAKIDALIEEQRRLIALLKEKRQAVISHAVTKGLDIACPMAESGFDWLGAYPAHWSLRRTSFLFKAEKGRSAALLTKEFCAVNAGVYPVYSGQTENDGQIGTWLQFEFDVGSIGALLVTTVGSDKVMSTKLVFDRFSLSQNCMIIRPVDPSVTTKFASYQFEPLFRYQKSMIPQHMQASFRMGDFYSFTFASPPIEEQNAIVDFLIEQDQKSSELLAQAARMITLLQERRSALISAAVTGKIDVRTYAAKPVDSVKPYNAAFARQVLGGEILTRCNDAHMGRTKLQKLIYLTEHHAQLSEIQGEYTREVAGPLDMKAMRGLARGLEKQHWFREEKQDGRFRYVPLDKHGQHAKYLQGWADKQARIDEVLRLLGSGTMRQCELVATLYAAWNDLLLDGEAATDEAILQQASTAEGWNASKERTAREKWVTALGWMKRKGLVPTGWGSHTRMPSKREAYEPA